MAHLDRLELPKLIEQSSTDTLGKEIRDLMIRPFQEARVHASMIAEETGQCA